MSPEERASAIIAHFPTLPQEIVPELSRVISSAIRKAVRAELKKSLKSAHDLLRATLCVAEVVLRFGGQHTANLAATPTHFVQNCGHSRVLMNGGALVRAIVRFLAPMRDGWYCPAIAGQNATHQVTNR